MEKTRKATKTETKTKENLVQNLVGKMGGLVFPVVQKALPTILKGYLEDLRESEESTEALREVVMAVFDNLIPRKHAVKAVKKQETIKEYIDNNWKPPETEEERKKVKKEHPEQVKYWRTRQVIYAFVGVTKKIMRKYEYHPSIEKAIRKTKPYFKKTKLSPILSYRIGQQWYREQIEELIHWIWPPEKEEEKETEGKKEKETSQEEEKENGGE